MVTSLDIKNNWIILEDKIDLNYIDLRQRYIYSIKFILGERS